MNMTMQVVTKLQTLSTEQGDPDPELPVRLTRAWLDIASAGMTLISGNQNIKNVDDKEGFFASAEGPAMLRAIVETRQRLLSAEAAKDKLLENLAAETQERHAQLLSIAVPPAYVTELSTESKSRRLRSI